MLGQDERKQFINSLIEEKVDRIKKVDIDIFSNEFKLDEYRNALHNAVKLFLLSRKGDRIRQPEYGGFFDHLLSEYDMNEEGKAKVEEDLTEVLSKYFEELIIKEVIATPHPESEEWEVGVTVIDPDTGVATDAKTQPIIISMKDKDAFLRTNTPNVDKIEYIDGEPEYVPDPEEGE